MGGLKLSLLFQDRRAARDRIPASFLEQLTRPPPPHRGQVYVRVTGMNLILWTEAREGHCLVALIPEHIWESADNPQRPNTCPSPGDGICQFPFVPLLWASLHLGWILVRNVKCGSCLEGAQKLRWEGKNYVQEITEAKYRSCRM